MIRLNPSTDEIVYSTIVFAQKQANQVGMYCAMLTFNQPLYLKSYKIKQDNQAELKKMNL